MPETQRPLKVFLSYASQDKPVVRELSRRLVGEGWIDTWLDEKKLLPGQDWRLAIEEAVEDSDIVIICLSVHSVSKEGHVQKELRYAREMALEKPEETIFLIPLRFDECEVPRGLRFYQWVDYFGERKAEGYDSLVESLKLRYEQKLRLEQEEGSRQEKSRKERDAAEKIAREKAEQEAVEEVRLEAEELARRKIAKQKAEREAAEKAAREKAQLEAEELARQKAAKEKTKRDADENAAREKAKPAPKPEIKKPQGNSNVIYWVVGFFAIVLVIWLSSLNGTPSTPVPTSTRTPLPQVSSSSTPIKTAIPSSVPSTKLVSTSTQLPANTALPLQTEITDNKGVQMALVPAGEFTMGTSADFAFELCKKNANDCDRYWDDYFKSASPSHSVYLDSYYIDKYEVTNVLYRVCVDAGVCDSPKDRGGELRLEKLNYDNYPVVGVDWDMAKKYCEWRSGYLPTEAQWEKAARGTDARTFPWGEEITCGKANYRATTGKSCFSGIDPNIDITYVYVTGVASIGNYNYGKSPYGLYDMAGNVNEWVADWYSATYYQSSPLSNPLGPESGDSHVVRGGDWSSTGEVASTFWRSISYGTSGFRCVSTP